MIFIIKREVSNFYSKQNLVEAVEQSILNWF